MRARGIKRHWFAAGLLVAAIAWHAFSSPFGHTLIAEAAIFAIFAMSLDLLGGYAGMISFGHAGFLGIGAYAFAYFSVILGWQPSVALLIAVLIGAAAAAFIGIFVIRTSGVFFIMVTLSLSMMFYAWAFRNPTFKGSNGMGEIPRLDLSLIGLDAGDPAVFSAFAIVICGVVWGALEFLVHSPLGYTLIAIRQNAGRMRSLGCPVFRYQLVAFVVSGSIATFAGVLTAQHTAFISPEIANWLVSGDVLIAVIIGGLGTLVGPILGSAILVVLRDTLSSFVHYWYFCLGLVFIFCALFAPAGICGRLLRPQAIEPENPGSEAMTRR